MKTNKNIPWNAAQRAQERSLTNKKPLSPVGDPRNNVYSDDARSCCGMIVCKCVEFSIEIGEDEPGRVQGATQGNREWAIEQMKAGLFVSTNNCGLVYRLLEGNLLYDYKDRPTNIWRAVAVFNGVSSLANVPWFLFTSGESEPAPQEATGLTCAQAPRPCVPVLPAKRGSLSTFWQEVRNTRITAK